MYSHFTKETRIKFSALLMSGLSLRAIAKLLLVSHSSLSRELRRNPALRSNCRYHPGDANRQATKRRYSANQRFRKLDSDSRLQALIINKLTVAKWSPQQISGWLSLSDTRPDVSHQSIYDWIYLRRTELRAYLHCRKGRYRRTRAHRLRVHKRQQLAASRHISQRPKHVDQRKRYGHWEGDTIHGARHSGYIATFVERKSGYLVAQLLTKADFSSGGFAIASQQAFKPIPAKYRRSLTLDNGVEMRFAEMIEGLTGLSTYYATPYHSWERATNENTNGLLRYFFPKKSSFSYLTQEQLDQAVYLLNTRPRKRLAWRTPAQMLRL